jgi:hypothetical protein
MADDNNTFLKDMIGKKGKGRPATNAPVSAPAYSTRPEPKNAAANSQDVHEYGILKLRLTDQKTQINRMTDYAEDSAIRLNDIYEILNQLRPQAQASSLDTYFEENGYIPVKVLNPCCEENKVVVPPTSGLGLDDAFDLGKAAKKLWPFLLRAAPWLAVASLSGDTNPELENKQLDRLKKEQEARELSDKKDFDGAAKTMKDFYANGGAKPATTFSIGGNPYNIDDSEFWRYQYLEDKGVNDLTDEIQNEAGIRKSTLETKGIAVDRDRQERSKYYENKIKELSDKIDGLLKEKPQQKTSQVSEKNYDSTNRDPATLSSPFYIGDVTAYGERFNQDNKVSNTTIKPERRVSLENVGVTPKSDISLASYGIEKDNTDNTILSGRKINFIAKEITYEADKFEFIDQSSVSVEPTSGYGADVTLASYGAGYGSGYGDYNIAGDSHTPSGKDSAANSYQVPSTHEGLTAKESAVINMISKRESSEGDEGYDMILGDRGRPGTSFLGVPPKPITEMTLNELYAWQTQMLRHPKNKATYGQASSAVGKGQFVRTTLFGGKDKYGNHIPGILEQMGIPQSEWGHTKFNKSLQDQLILRNFRDNVGDPNADPSTWSMRGLGNQWEAFKNKPLSQGDLNSLSGVRPADTSNELGPHADIARKSASTTKELNTPVKTTGSAVSMPSVVNISSPAYTKVDEPLAAGFDTMWERLQDNTLMQYA